MQCNTTDARRPIARCLLKHTFWVLNVSKGPCSKMASTSCHGLQLWYCKIQLLCCPEYWLFLGYSCCLLTGKALAHRNLSRWECNEWEKELVLEQTHRYIHTWNHIIIFSWRQLQLDAISEQPGTTEPEVCEHQMLLVLPFLLCHKTVTQKGSPSLCPWIRPACQHQFQLWTCNQLFYGPKRVVPEA